MKLSTKQFDSVKTMTKIYQVGMRGKQSKNLSTVHNIQFILQPQILVAKTNRGRNPSENPLIIKSTSNLGLQNSLMG